MSHQNRQIAVDDLLALIGRQLVYDNQQCEIVELLDDRLLVLQVLDKDNHIQATQYGEGHRAVPTTYELTIFDGEGELHPELVAAGLQALLPE